MKFNKCYINLIPINFQVMIKMLIKNQLLGMNFKKTVFQRKKKLFFKSNDY